MVFVPKSLNEFISQISIILRQNQGLKFANHFIQMNIFISKHQFMIFNHTQFYYNGLFRRFLCQVSIMPFAFEMFLSPEMFCFVSASTKCDKYIFISDIHYF